MDRLLPCHGCSRHRRTSERACPFCGSKRLALGAGVIVFAALGVGWSGDAGPDASTAPAPTDAAGPPRGRGPVDASLEPRGRQPGSGYDNVIPVYGVPPQPRRPGC